MSLEQALAANTAAMEALTAALSKGGAAADKATPADKTAGAAAGKGKGKPAASKFTLDQVKAAIVKVRDAQGTPAAKEIISGPGAAEKMDSIKPENFEAVIKACEEALDGGGEETSEDDDI